MAEITTKKRVPEIDILKGITIILVVIGHTRVPGNNFIYLFHMAVFFIASGYFYSDKSSNNIKSVAKTVVRRIRTLWLPFFLGITIFTLLNNFFIYTGILTSNNEIYKYVAERYVTLHSYLGVTDIAMNIIKAALFSGSAQLAGTFWFFKTLFIVSVMYCSADYLIKKLDIQNRWMAQCIISIVLLVTGWIFSKKEILGFAVVRAAIVYCLYYIGNYLQKKINLSLKMALLLSGAALIILLICNNIGSIALDKIEIVNPLFFISTSLAGWFLLYGISRLIADLDKSFISIGIRGVLQYIGRHSLVIMIGHFISFKIVSQIVILANGLPQYCLAAFPVLNDSGLWWISYTVMGVVIPLIVGEIWHRCKQSIVK